MSKELIDELLTEAGIQRSKFAPDCAGLLEAAAAALAQPARADVELDAARYRWLRGDTCLDHSPRKTEWEVLRWGAPYWTGDIQGADLDAAIDSDMLADSPEAKA
jgi:hypothetical protein